MTRHPAYGQKYAYDGFLNLPYNSSSVQGTHLYSRAWTFLSTRRYNGKLIFHGRVNTFGSSIVASYIM